MSKVLAATCLSNVVKVGTLSIPSTGIFSEGVAQSDGILILEGGEKFYFARITPDLKTTIEKTSTALTDIASALTEIGTALTAIAAVPSGWVTPPATIAANVAVITSKVAAISTTQAALDTLKGSLR